MNRSQKVLESLEINEIHYKVGVSSCTAKDCKFNKNFSCTLDSIQIVGKDRHKGHGVCFDFKAK